MVVGALEGGPVGSSRPVFESEGDRVCHDGCRVLSRVAGSVGSQWVSSVS